MNFTTLCHHCKKCTKFLQIFLVSVKILHDSWEKEELLYTRCDNIIQDTITNTDFNCMSDLEEIFHMHICHSLLTVDSLLSILLVEDEGSSSE